MRGADLLQFPINPLPYDTLRLLCTQARRADKAAFKASFANERKRQTKAAQARVAGGAAADVGRNGVANGGTMRLL